MTPLQPYLLRNFEWFHGPFPREGSPPIYCHIPPGHEVFYFFAPQPHFYVVAVPIHRSASLYCQTSVPDCASTIPHRSGNLTCIRSSKLIRHYAPSRVKRYTCNNVSFRVKPQSSYTGAGRLYFTCIRVGIPTGRTKPDSNTGALVTESFSNLKTAVDELKRELRAEAKKREECDMVLAQHLAMIEKCVGRKQNTKAGNRKGTRCELHVI